VHGGRLRSDLHAGVYGRLHLLWRRVPLRRILVPGRQHMQRWHVYPPADLHACLHRRAHLLGHHLRVRLDGRTVPRRTDVQRRRLHRRRLVRRNDVLFP